MVTTSYEGVESRDNFHDEDHEERYRHRSLLRAQPDVALISEFAQGTGLRVLDVGSGNSALPIGLIQISLASSAIAIEPSSSRNQFAERWRTAWRIPALKNIHASFEDAVIPNRSVDIVSCLGTFHLFEAYEPKLPMLFCQRAFAWLCDGGTLILRLPIHERPQGVDRESFWLEMTDDDPFVYALYEKLARPSAKQTLMRSVYLRSDGSFAAKQEEVRNYRSEEIREILEASGFEDIEIRSGVDIGKCENGKSQDMIVIAIKPPIN